MLMLYLIKLFLFSLSIINQLKCKNIDNNGSNGIAVLPKQTMESFLKGELEENKIQ